MNAESDSSPPEVASAGVLRRVAAIVYDLFPVLALAIVATLPFLPFLHGRHFIASEVGVLAYVHWGVVLLVGAGFFVFFWVRRGQTIGMVTWRLRMQRPDGSLIDWKQASVRVAIVMALWMPFFVGYALIWGRWPDPTMRKLAIAVSLLPVILAYLWIWIDRDRLAWHDRWTGTRVVVLPKRNRR